MPERLNEDIAGRLDEVADLLDAQGASRYRVGAYRRAAATLRRLPRPVSERVLADRLHHDLGIESTFARRDSTRLLRRARIDRLFV